MDGLDPEALRRLVAKGEPAELRGYLAVPSGGPFVAGSTVRSLAQPAATTASGLMLPGSVRTEAPMDFAGAYATLANYGDLDDLGGSTSDITAAVARMQSFETLFLHLALLNHLEADEAKRARVSEEFLALLNPHPRERLINFVRSSEAGQNRILARQPILAAMKYLLLNPPDGAGSTSVPPLSAAVLLSHAVAVELQAERETDEDISGIPEYLFFEIVRVSLLYEQDDMWASIDRYVRLWRDYGAQIKTFPLRRPPCELLEEATGLTIEELIGLGFAQYSHDSQGRSGKPPFLRPDMGSGMPPEKVEAFRRLMAATTGEYRQAFEAVPESRFDFLPFQERPIWRTEHGYVSVDLRYLWDRVTRGLYWIVHDAERQRSEAERQRWTQGFAEAVEALAESEIETLAPPILGGGVNIYTEDDFEAAYGPQKRCDIAIDFGNAGLLTEIVSGQLTVPTRVAGSHHAFERDTRRLVLDKCRQLHEAAEALLADSMPLLGYAVPGGYRIFPMLVVGGGYPVTPFTMKFVGAHLDKEGLLSQPMMQPLAIVDLGELETLEGLAERGRSPLDVLAAWQESGIAHVPLRNFVLRRFGGGRDLRPSRMDDRVNATFEAIIQALKLPPGDGADSDRA